MYTLLCFSCPGNRTLLPVTIEFNGEVENESDDQIEKVVDIQIDQNQNSKTVKGLNGKTKLLKTIKF